MPTHPTDEHRTVDPRIVASGNGAMVFDASLSEAPTRDWFDRAWWQAQNRLRTAEAGRGGVAFLDTPDGPCVLRHYRRGGWMQPLLGDRYVWNGRTRSRGFAEFRLLAELRMRGLPVPAPIAARYQRRGPYYTADLITREIEGAKTLTQVIEAQRFDGALAGQVGALVARFHAGGVDHADLNAHNILLAKGELWLIDFDRGEVRVTGTAWKLSNLARLKRSLLKVGACDHDETTLDREIWTPLMRAYERGTGGQRMKKGA
ncbi:MAG TPA: 3-deoxy-D-manno-octulosonic acid kinase [Rhodanobacteraceae bacterium]|nr:3-deoxy-D-manno-octulosonic acid kinase [Rhodanobacteraceae bacterium]